MSFDWLVRSNWIASPKAITLSPAERLGKVIVVSRRTNRGADPKIEAPSRLNVVAKPCAEGWEITISARTIPDTTLQTVKLQFDDEAISIPVLFVPSVNVAGGPKP